MAWKSTTKLRESRSRADRKGTADVDYYQVVFDAPATPAEARVAPDVPRVGSIVDGNPFKVIQTAEAEHQGGSLTVFRVTVTTGTGGYSQPIPREPDEDPTMLPPEVDIDSEDYLVPVFKDKSGNAIVNSAGEPFEDQPTKEMTDRIITVKKYVASYRDSDWRGYIKAVNSVPFMGYLADTVRCETIRASFQYNEAQPFVQVTAVFRQRDDDPDGSSWWKAFKLNVLDQGYNEKVSGKLVPILNKDGIPVKSLLNGSGAKVALGGAAVARLFNVYDRLDFGPLANFLGL